MQAPEISVALEIYHRYFEIGTKEINRLFGGSVSSATIAKLKKRAREQMEAEGNVITCSKHNVNTKAAYKAWGLDAQEMERRYKKCQALGLN